MENAFGQPQNVVLLGGTSDIGEAIVAQLASPALRRVILGCRDVAGGEAVAERLRAPLAERGAGAASVEVVSFEATATDDHQRLIDDLAARHGDLDLVIVAFAQLGDPERVGSDARAAAELATVNFTGAVSASVAAANLLRRQGHGTLLVISSVAGERVRKENYVYGGTKAGLDGFAQGLSDSMVGSGARVVILRPGFVHTSMTVGRKPAPFSTTVAAVAEQTVAGLRRGKRIIWAPGILRYVMAVLRHLPTPVWRKVSDR